MNRVATILVLCGIIKYTSVPGRMGNRPTKQARVMREKLLGNKLGSGRFGRFSNECQGSNGGVFAEGSFKVLDGLEVQDDPVPLHKFVDIDLVDSYSVSKFEHVDSPRQPERYVVLASDEQGLSETEFFELDIKMLGLAIGPVESGHDSQFALLHFGAESNTHSHLNDLAWKLGAKVARLGSECNTSTVEHGTLSVTETRTAGTLLGTNLGTRTTNLATRLGRSGSLPQPVEMVNSAEMENVAADGVVKNGGVECHNVFRCAGEALGRLERLGEFEKHWLSEGNSFRNRGCKCPRCASAALQSQGGDGLSQ